MHQLGNLGNVVLKDTQRVGVGHHHTGNGVVEQRFEVFHIDGAVRTTLNHHHIKAAHSSTGRVGAMRAVGHDNLGALLVATAHVIAADNHKACELAVCTGKGVEREFAHASQFGKTHLQVVVNLQSAIDCSHGLQGMQTGEVGMSRHVFVDLGIVLHRTRTQGIETGVDTKVVVAHVGVVTHHGEFVNLGQRRSLGTHQVSGQGLHLVVGAFILRKRVTTSSFL